jgi:hypothetical protein
MGLLERVKFAAWDNAGAVVDLIKKWVPGKCNTEKDYENSLYDYLHAELGSIQITKQFGHGRIKADLAVGDKVLLELKHNLDSTAKLQRLIGQLEGYRELDKTVVVLLTGKTDPNLRKDLQKTVEALNHRDFNPIAVLGSYQQFVLVEK